MQDAEYLIVRLNISVYLTCKNNELGCLDAFHF